MKNGDIVQKLLAWFARHARDLPWRRTRDPYAIWVSEIMLQQTQVKTVLPYWRRWLRALPHLAALADAPPATLHKLWEGLGYYARVRNLQRAAQIIQQQHHGRFPRDFDAVRALPGIGRYTAGAICSIAFNQPRPVLDGNVMRVLARLYGVAGNPRAGKANARLWELAEALVRRAAGLRARRGCAALNQSLMELGALVCAPRQPRCALCPVSGACVAHRTGRVAELPERPRRTRPTPRRFMAFVVERHGRVLVRQRPAGGVNARLWEFPNVEVAPGDSDARAAARKALGRLPAALEPLAALQHTITRYRITLAAYRAAWRGETTPSRAGARWVERRALNQLAFASAHRKILRQLQAGPGKPS